MSYLPREYYIKNSTTDQEYEKVFKKSWLLAGLTDDLAKNNDFVTFEIYGRSVVVQNFNGKLAAFQNVCAHRFNRIQGATKGNRPFLCQYHGWTYNSEGLPIGVPQKSSFDPAELECAHLKKYAVDTVGRFVFVKMDTDDKTTLVEYLANFHERLLEMSKHIAEELFYEDVPHAANWKLLVENVNEGYHCPILHKESFIKSGFCKIAAINTEFSGKHSKWDGPKVIDENNKMTHKKMTFIDTRSLKHDTYYHQHIYPSFMFASTEGYFFFIGVIMPVDAENSVLRVRYFAPTRTDHSKPFFQKAFFDSNVQGGVQILKEEDQPIVEQCQKGLREETNSKGLLSSTEEVRLIEFHKVYLNDMNNVQ